jgi:hypothetical protein
LFLPCTAHAQAAGADAEIVVTADRYGEASVRAETELGEEEIGSYGADSVGELVKDIAPLIDATGEEPVILVNGERIGSAAEISVYPAEVLQRLAVLAPEAAARYGYPANRRVVNLVLKKKFATWQVEGSTTIATAGGRDSERAAVGRTVIAGPTRWNVRLQMSRDSALFKSERRIPTHGDLVDPVGRIVAADGSEIDPALSQLVGEPVFGVSIPPSLEGRIPTLRDFAATAGQLGSEDPNRFETLLPAGRDFTFNAGVTRRLGPFSASLGLNANMSHNSGRFGIPMAAITLPAASPWSPFGRDVTLVRSLDGTRALRTEQESKSLGLSLVLTGSLGDWRTTLIANYSRNWTDNFLERGIGVDAVQTLVAAGDPAFDPYGPWPEDLLSTRRNHSRGEALNAQLNVAKSVVALPAGDVVANVTIRANRNRSESWSVVDIDDLGVSSEMRRNQANGQLSLSIPIASRGGGLKALGDMSADLAISGQVATRTALRHRFDGGINWSPFRFLQLRGSLEYEQVIPSFEQLSGPRLETINRIYDYNRQEIAEPLWITGGNPALDRGNRQRVSLNAMLRPFAGQAITLNLGYRSDTTEGGATSFPALTPAIEAAFPGRVTRDGSGRLIAVDARAINIAHDSRAQLSTGISVRLPGARKPVKDRLPRDPLQLTLSLTHRWQLKDELLIRRGVPAIDQLGDGGRARHNAQLQLVAAKKGVGANLSGTWTGPGRIRGGSAGQPDFHYRASMLFDLELYLEPGRLARASQPSAWMKNLKFSLDVRNLFDGYRRVTLSDGSVPPGYGRDEIDPLGRTVQFSIRKSF